MTQQLANMAHLDIILLSDPRFDAEQMKEVRLAFMNGIDPTSFADVRIPHETMRQIRYLLDKYQ